MPPLSGVWERLAQSYALQVSAGKITIDQVPTRPDTLRPRVEELVTDAV